MNERRPGEISFWFALCVVMCALGLGVLASVADIALNMPPRPPRAQGQVGGAGQPSIEELRVIFSACVVFYGVAYTTGHLFFSWVGAKTLAEEVRSASRGHMPLLNFLLGIWLIVSGWQAAPNAVVLPPSFFVGLILVAWAVYGAWSNWREWSLSRNDDLPDDLPDDHWEDSEEDAMNSNETLGDDEDKLA